MEEIRDAFVRATNMAQEAGFDMLELHCAHGYLLSSFITPLLNRRTDEYGGTLENRLRYPLEVFHAIRAVWPSDRPISVRISATDWMAGGISGDDAVEIARAFKVAGADLIDVSTGQTSPDAKPVYGRMFQTPYADQIRNEIGIATMAVGNVTEPIKSTPSSRLGAPTWSRSAGRTWPIRAGRCTPRPSLATRSRLAGAVPPRKAAARTADRTREGKVVNVRRLDIDGKHAIVTGGARGIGLAIAIALVGVPGEGQRREPLGVGRFRRKPSDSFARRRRHGGSGNRRERSQTAAKRTGRLRSWLTTPELPNPRPLAARRRRCGSEILATNLTGPFLCTREAAADMMIAKWGRIVTYPASLVSAAGRTFPLTARANTACRTDAGLAAEFEGTGVTANVICPGYTETAMMRKAIANIARLTGADEDAARARLAQSNPQGRIASVDEVAAAALELIAGTSNGLAVVVPSGAAS